MRTAICAIVKNEHRYLEEWIEYHLSIGFDEIWIGEDYESKSHQSIVDKFDKQKVHILSLLDFLPNEHVTLGGCGRQVKLYNKFLRINREKFDWIAFIDIDEFIVLENQSLSDFLNDYDDYEGVCLAWKYFGANGHLTPPEGGVLKNFTKPSFQPLNDCQVKSIVNCKKATSVLFMHAATHGCVNVFKEYAFQKSLYGFGYAREKYWHKAWINHYFTRSWQEWVERMVRGNFHNNYRTLDTFFEYNKDMAHMQEELTLKAANMADKFMSLNNIYSKKYSLYNKQYSKFIKRKFLEKIHAR